MDGGVEFPMDGLQQERVGMWVVMEEGWYRRRGPDGICRKAGSQHLILLPTKGYSVAHFMRMKHCSVNTCGGPDVLSPSASGVATPTALPRPCHQRRECFFCVEAPRPSHAPRRWTRSRLAPLSPSVSVSSADLSGQSVSFL